MKKMSLNRGISVFVTIAGCFIRLIIAQRAIFFDRISQEFSLGYTQMREEIEKIQRQE